MNNSDHGKIDEILENMPPTIFEEMLDKISGISPDERKEKNRINSASKQYLHLPVEMWPDFEIKWDLSAENYIFVFDGMKRNNFRENYPEGFSLGWVDFQELESKLARFSQRSIAETWDIGVSEKVARAILYWVEGNEMTPPLIIPVGKEVNIAAGHHRVAVCRGKKIQTMPVLTKRTDRDLLEQNLQTLKWANDT
ncbi:hypothetical protein [uncultured Desulfuromusa sp.]|uniref:hypothetical protein n=1 Tax=uncultured Desulfuromusa sp. TaxID=219183 RepID=UPI002AA6BEC3|nr:hypothetical protein [uncultured Desulfuromusa sp.]